MASLFDLERKRREKSISSNSPSKSCCSVLCLLPSETRSFGTALFSSPARLQESLPWACRGPGPHTIQPAAQMASSTEGARELKDGVPSGQPSFLWPSV